MTNTKQLREHWDELVPEYDLNNHRKWFWSSPYAWADEIARRITDCKKVLDVYPTGKGIRFIQSGFFFGYANAVEDKKR
jgi:hypothetical protein